MSAMGVSEMDGPYFRGGGCEECRGTGYRGRVGIFELLAINNELRELIVKRRSNAELKTVAQRSMTTMHQDALSKASQGVTTLEEILRVSSGDLE
jgi:type II secretory ATPase GspE/PulE/Tfp pilus assembly ATPase PilB-like protein